MIAGHCIRGRQDADVGLSLPSVTFLLLSFSLCVLEEEQLLWSGQGGKDNTTSFHWES